eukprot:11221740-Alexandrium_andersonii.AAC.1
MPGHAGDRARARLASGGVGGCTQEAFHGKGVDSCAEVAARRNPTGREPAPRCSLDGALQDPLRSGPPKPAVAGAKPDHGEVVPGD